MKPLPPISYKGYTGVVTDLSSSDDDPPKLVQSGHVVGLRDVITFTGTGRDGVACDLDTLREFKASVDIYLEACAASGVEPEMPKP